MSRHKFNRIVSWILVAAIFFFLAKMVWSNWVQVKEASFSLRFFPLFSGTVFFAVSYFFQLWAWYLITQKLGIALSFPETTKTWFYSQAGKYLPGKIWLFLGRVYFYESKGKSKKSVSVALYFEAATLLVAGGLICLAALLLFEEMGAVHSNKILGWLVIACILLAFIFLHPRVLQKILNWVLVLFKREPLVLSISYWNILWVLFYCILSWVVGGIGFYLFVDAVYPLSSHYILFLTGALAVSNTLGLIAIFAPGGLGVREGVLVYLLSFVTPVPVAVILSVLTRIWMTLIEIGLIGIVYLVDKIPKGSVRKGRVPN